MEEVLAATIATSATLVLPLFMDGVERKVKAWVHSRIGPPVTQTLLDALKLLKKETRVFGPIPYYFYLSSTAAVLTALGVFSAYMYFATLNTAYFVYTLVFYLTSQAALALSYLIIPNPYSVIGGFREVFVSLVNEPFMVLGVVLYAVSFSSRPGLWGYVAAGFSFSAVLVASYVSSRRTPFDLSEAEPEIASGGFIELSGKALFLALYNLLLSRSLSQLIPLSLVAMAAGPGGPLAPLAYLASLAGVWALYGLASTLMGRARVDTAFKSLVKLYLVLIAGAFVGLVV